MTWDSAFWAIGFVFGIGTLFSLLTSHRIKSEKTKPLTGYLLAGESMGKVPVQNLLLSTFFGLNGVFYQGYLGLMVGAWGIVIQFIWSLGVFWFARYTPIFKEHHGLHDFLAVRFGPLARLTAAVLSIIGMTVFIGWETDIGRSTVTGLVGGDDAWGTWYVAGLALLTLLYTVWGGLQGNAWVNVFQNIIKFGVFGTLLACLGWAYFQLPGMNTGTLLEVFFPSFETIQARMGWWGFFTNMVFSLVWQFSDMTTWQSLGAGRNASVEEQKFNLRMSGLMAFISPGILGTMLGVFLAHTSSTDNVVVGAVEALGGLSPLFGFMLLAACAACVMSTIDGLFLGSAYTVVVDLLHPKERMEDIEADKKRARRALLYARGATILIAVVALWLIPILFKALGYNSAFDAVYLVTVSQLSLVGPVLIGLWQAGRNPRHAIRKQYSAMWLAMVGAFAVGFTAAISGSYWQMQWLTDGASVFTIATSLGLAWLIARK